MSEPHSIFWIQGLDDGAWRNLQRCDDHNDAIARMGPLLSDQHFSELRLVLAQSQDGRIDYTTLVTTRDGKVVSDAPLIGGLPPPPNAPPAAARRKWPVAMCCGILAAAVAGGIVIANYDWNLAIAFYERAVSLTQMAPSADPPNKKVSDPPKKQVADPPAIQASVPPAAKSAAPQTRPSYSRRLFAAVDADDAAAMRRLMAARAGDIRLDELRDFVDDSWGTGPRMIVDYALLGGHLAAAEALLAAGVTPSDWLRGVIARNVNLAKLRPAIALMMEFGALPEIAVEAAIKETNRELGGN